MRFCCCFRNSSRNCYRVCYRSMSTFDINMEQLKKLQDEGATLLDIRSPQEYNEGHLNGAISIPEYELYRKASNKLKDKNETIIVYCGTGSRSKKAQIILQRLGYLNVYNLYKGTENY